MSWQLGVELRNVKSSPKCTSLPRTENGSEMSLGCEWTVESCPWKEGASAGARQAFPSCHATPCGPFWSCRSGLERGHSCVWKVSVCVCVWHWEQSEPLLLKSISLHRWSCSFIMTWGPSWTWVENSLPSACRCQGMQTRSSENKPIGPLLVQSTFQHTGSLLCCKYFYVFSLFQLHS